MVHKAAETHSFVLSEESRDHVVSEKSCLSLSEVKNAPGGVRQAKSQTVFDKNSVHLGLISDPGVQEVSAPSEQNALPQGLPFSSVKVTLEQGVLYPRITLNRLCGHII